MNYTICNTRNQIIKTTLSKEFSEHELKYLIELLAIDTGASTDRFLSTFRELKDKCPLINQLCCPQGFFRKIFYSFKSDTKKAERYKIIIDQLRTGKDQNNLKYFRNYLQELSVGQKINTILIEKFKKTFDHYESINNEEQVVTQNINNFNKSINFIGAFNTSNLNNFSENSSELLTSYINLKAEYSCLSDKNVDNTLDQVNILGIKISELKKRFFAELMQEVTRLYGKNPDNNINPNTRIWEDTGLNPKIGSLIKQIHKKYKDSVEFFSNKFKNRVEQRIGIKPYSLNFRNMTSPGYCSGISVAATYLSTKQLYSNQWLYDNAKLNIIDDLQKLRTHYEKNGSFVYPIAFICQGLGAALADNGYKFFDSYKLNNYIRGLRNCISDKNLYDLLTDMVYDTEIIAIFNRDTFGIYGYFINFHQIGQSSRSSYSPNIESILQKDINTQYSLLDKKDIANTNIVFSLAREDSIRMSNNHAITIKIEKKGGKVELLLIDSNRKLGPLYFIIKKPEEIVNISAQLALYLKKNGYNVICNSSDSLITDIEYNYRNRKNVPNSFDLIEENRSIHDGQTNINGKYTEQRFTGECKITATNSSYQGELLNSKIFGLGTLKLGDHKKVKGKFWDGAITTGEYRVLNDIYKGSLKYGMPHGYGIYKFSNGDVYEGFFNHGKKHGYGILKSDEGEIIYKGNFINDEKEDSVIPIS